MSLSNEELAHIFREGHLAQMQAIESVDKRVGSVEQHLARLNGNVERNTKELGSRPCTKHGEELVALKTVVGLSPSPMDAGKAIATQEAHKVNWGRVWGIVAGVLGLLLAASIGGLLIP